MHLRSCAPFLVFPGRRWAAPLLAALGLSAALSAGPVAAQDEVPFIVTPDRVTLAMLELAGVKPNDFLVDLGSGDGRIVITAAKRFGARGLGVEIVPDLVDTSQRNARLAGVAERAEFRAQDLFATDLGAASVVTLYLLPEVNLQWRPRLLALAPGTRIVSHDWDMGDWRPDRSLTLEVPDKPIGREKRSVVHLWVVPAPLAGWWCAAGMSLQVTQRFQDVSATLAQAGAAAPLMVFDGRATADALHDGADAAAARLVLRWRGGALETERASGPAASLPARLRFTRGGAAGCG